MYCPLCPGEEKLDSCTNPVHYAPGPPARSSAVEDRPNEVVRRLLEVYEMISLRWGR
jgi:hypothetical protein